MKLNHKLIAYRAIIFIPFLAVFSFACVGWACEKIVDKYDDFGGWLQSKIFK